VLELSAVFAVDQEGMEPIHEADESMRSRQASLRLTSVSAAVASHLDDARHGPSLVIGSPPAAASPEPTGGPEPSDLDDVNPDRGQD
jgi:hypothetical protein